MKPFPARAAHCARILALLTCLSPAPAEAQSSGAWRTFLRPYDYEAMLVAGDTVWCATRAAGLFLYSPSDGTFGTVYRTPGGLSSNALTSMALDARGSLWFGTQASGVSRLRPDRATWQLVNAFDGLPSEAIRCLAVDPRRDSLWIGTQGGIALWSGDEIAGRLPDGVNPSPFASDDITGIVVRSDSQFIATAAGAYLRRPAGGASVIDTINAGLFTGNVRAMVTNGVDILALDTGAAWRFNFTTGLWGGTAGIGTIYRLQAAGGEIFASSQNGLYRWTGATWQIVAPTLVSNGNRGGAFAAATAGPNAAIYAANLNGVYTVPAGGGVPLLAVPETAPGNNLLNVVHDGSRLYVNSLDEGIGRFDGVRWRNWYPGGCGAGCDTTFTNPLVPFALVTDQVGRTKWFACWGIQLDIMDDTGPVPQFTRPVWSDGFTFGQHTSAAVGVVDSTNGIWFGMDTGSLGKVAPIGIDQYDATGAFVRNLSPGQNGQRGNGKIKALTVDGTNRLWVGHTGEGLQYFNVPASVATIPQFLDVAGTTGLDIRGLDASGDTIWAATTAGVRTHRSTTGNLIGTYPNPPGGSIDDLALNPIAVGTDGRVWLGTSNGVRVYRRDGSTSADFNIDNSPLPGNVVRAIRVEKASGAVWIATSNGLARFDPFYTPPPAPELARLDVRTYPNPAPLSGVGAIIRLSGNATSYRGAIYDIGGRLMHRFSGAADRSVIWNGRDEDGIIARPGVYFMHVEAGGRAKTTRIVLLR
jgi:ligand-binding sensor domain-containing protein